jgi:hypothetical protein
LSLIWFLFASYKYTDIYFSSFKIASSEWFVNLPGSVHACFYKVAADDPETLAAFANCQLINGGKECIQQIPAALNCLNNIHNQ